MVAFNFGRRAATHAPGFHSPVEALTRDRGVSINSVLHAASSHRAAEYVELRKDAHGGLVEVRIGRRRVIAAGSHRRLAEVRELGGHRVAVRIENLAANGATPSSEIWQLYRLDGRLEAALQTTPDGRFALLTDYRTRQVCRLVADAHGELRTVETWRI